MATIVGANEIYKKLSSQIETQFPGFIREEGSQFVAFLKAYFEYMEQSGKAGNAIRALQDNQDIDRTIDSFVEYFRREFMLNIPKDVLADKRLLAKHIKEFYRSRGSQESYRFLFRALYNTEVDFYYPGDDILRASDGRWVQETKLRVSSPLNTDPQSFEAKRITGERSKATAFVVTTQRLIASGVTVFDLSLESISGTFLDGERVVDEDGKFATVDSQIGSLRSISVTSGGAGHQVGDSVEISGAGSTLVAKGVVEAITNDSAVTARVVKPGTGYTKTNSRLLITGGSGSGFSAKISSYSATGVSTTYNTDSIYSVKDVKLNANSFFVRGGANSAVVNAKLIGTVKTFSTSNTVYGQGSNFTSQLQVGDIVRVVGQANTLRVHSITSAQTFVSAIRPVVTQVASNAYIRFAAANVYSKLSNALTFRTEELYDVNAIAIINPGTGYAASKPTIRIVDDFVGPLAISDGFGGLLGNNAVVVANNLAGSITSVRITDPGENFNRAETSSIRNLTQGNNIVTTSFSGVSVENKLQYELKTESLDQIVMENGDILIEESSIVTYSITKKTFNGEGVGIPSGVIRFPGKYIDTKGFLSWNNRLQDNYYYQEFSYVIRVSEIVEKYRKIVNGLLHPAGTKMFGEFTSVSEVSVPPTFILTKSKILGIAIDEQLTLSEDWRSVFVVPGNTAESFTSTDTYSSFLTVSRNTAESISASDSYAGLKFKIVPNLYARVQVANNVIQTYESTQSQVYDSWPIGVLDGNPRLVSNSAGSSYFANSSFKANTGYINVGGPGTSVILLPIGNTSYGTYTLQVNTIISNTTFTIRTNMPGGAVSNTTFYLGS